MKKKGESFDSARDRESLTAGVDPVIYQQGSDKGQLIVDPLARDRELLREGFAPGNLLLAEEAPGSSRPAALATRPGREAPLKFADEAKRAKAGDDGIALDAQVLFCSAEAPRPPVEKDGKGRINRINYPDGSYRTVGYNHNNDPCEFVHFDKDGKEIHRMKLAFGFDPPERYTVKDDGTVEKTVDTVRVTRGDTIYDRTGREIGYRGITSREQLFDETFNPDGTHSIRRKYPDGSSREVVELNGMPFRYTYSGRDGTDVWMREEKSDVWYEARDKERKRPWVGTPEFRPDGRLVEMDKNGVSEVSQGGRRDYSDPTLWRADILRIADQKLSTAEEKKQFRSDVEDLEARVQKRELSAEKATAVYKEAYRLFCGESKVGVESAHLKCVGSQVVHQAAHPEDVDQGMWDQCHVTDSELRLWYRQPELAARIAADNALNGKHTTPSGETVNVAKSVRPADKASLKTPPGDNVRSYATQLVNLTAINLEVQEFNRAHGTNLEYIQGPVTDKSNGAMLVDNSTKPPSPVYCIDGNKPILHSEVVRNEKGEVVLGPDLRPQMMTPMACLNMSIQNSVSVLEKLTGKPQMDIAIGHFNEAGQADNWILDKVGLASDIRKDKRIAFFKDEKSLGVLLSDAQRKGRMPLILQANTGSGFLRKQVEEANGQPLGGEGGNFGGGHVVCIRSFNEFNNTVEIDGTWGRKRDKIGKQAVTLAEVVEISKANPQLQAEARQYEADKRAAYKQWCATYGKKEGVDYPDSEAGKAWFKKYRAR